MIFLILLFLTYLAVFGMLFKLVYLEQPDSLYITKLPKVGVSNSDLETLRKKLNKRSPKF